MRPTADSFFLRLLVAAAIPLGAVVFALTRAAHDLEAVLSKGPTPVAGLCRETIAYSLSPLAHASYGGFAAIALLSASLGLFAAVTTHARTRRRLTGELVRDEEPPKRLRDAALAAGVPRVRLLETPQPRAYTFGYLRPTVGMSRGLLDRLDDSELEAVLRHEGAHVRKRDPLRMLVVATITRALLFAPLIGRLSEGFQIAKEIDADQAVIAGMGSRRALVSALIAAGQTPNGAGAVAGFSDTLSARIAWLEGEDLQAKPVGSWRAAVVTSAAVLTVAAGLFVITTGAVDAHVLRVCSDNASAF